MQISKFKEVRKTILKFIPIPSFVSKTMKESDPLFLKREKLKFMLQKAFGLRLSDSEPEVRKEAYLKLTRNGFKIEDFESTETKLLIVKEGLTDRDEKVKIACRDFLKNSIMRKVALRVSKKDLDAKSK
jgi:hypothetical protein